MAYGIYYSKMAASLSFGVLNFSDKTSSNSDSWQDANTALAELDKGRLLKLFIFLFVALFDLFSVSKGKITRPINLITLVSLIKFKRCLLNSTQA